MDISTFGNTINQATKRIAVASVVVLFSIGILLAVVTGVRGPTYYYNWGLEGHLFTFASSLQYFVAAEIAFICFWIARSLRGSNAGGVHRPWLWLPISFGFALAACDEMLCWHERLLPRFGYANPWFRQLALGQSDNLFVIGISVVALIFTIFFLRELVPVRRAVAYYGIGLFLLILAGAIDYLPRPMLQQRLPLGTEELAEYFSGTTFSIAFLYYALDRFRLVLLGALVSGGEPGNAASAAVEQEPATK